MERKWLNLTPHSINIVDEEGNLIKEFPPSGGALRLRSLKGLLGHLDGVPIIREELGSPELQGLPEKEIKGAYVIVSSVVASSPEALEWLLGRGAFAVLVPTDFVRDENGRIVGAKALRLVEGEIPCPYCGFGHSKDAVIFENGRAYFCPPCGNQFPADWE